MPSGSNKLTLSRIVFFVVAAVAALLVLRFVFSIAMSVVKFIALGALAVFVVWLFLGKDDKGGGDRGGGA